MTGTLLLLTRTALVALLYVFLGWALITVWQSLRAQKKNIPHQSPSEVWLTAQIGESLQKHPLRGKEIILGRDPTCDYPLPSETVSAQHARLSFHHGQWWLEDLQSTNGSLLNGERVEVPVVVTVGDQIRCGEVLLKIENEAAARSA